MPGRAPPKRGPTIEDLHPRTRRCPYHLRPQARINRCRGNLHAMPLRLVSPGKPVLGPTSTGAHQCVLRRELECRRSPCALPVLAPEDIHPATNSSPKRLLEPFLRPYSKKARSTSGENGRQAQQRPLKQAEHRAKRANMGHCVSHPRYHGEHVAPSSSITKRDICGQGASARSAPFGKSVAENVDGNERRRDDERWSVLCHGFDNQQHAHDEYLPFISCDPARVKPCIISTSGHNLQHLQRIG